MKRFALGTWISVLAAAAGVGCTGSDFQWRQASQLRPGLTQDQVESLMGRPTDVRARDQGAVWTWTYLSPAGGEARSVSVVMRDGRVVDAPVVPQTFR